MKKIFRIASLIFTFEFILLSLPSFANAMCPICTVAAGTGVVIFRDLGIDDTITGLWLGGLLLSATMWTVNWLEARKWRFFGRNFFTGAVYFALVLIPFYQKNMISDKILGNHFQTLWGVDKLVLGIIFGGILFLIGAAVYNILKKNNGGKAVFPFSKVVLPISPLIIMSIVFYFVTK